MRPTIGKFFVVSLAVTIAFCGLCYWPTVRLAGSTAGPAVLAGSLAALLASWIGAVPVFLAPRQLGGSEATWVLASVAVRSFSAILLGTGLALGGWFSLGPLLLCLTLNYMALLPVDVLFAIAWLRARRGAGGCSLRAQGGVEKTGAVRPPEFHR